MCGIVGCVGKIWQGEENAFKLLLQLDTIRGSHSTGVMSVGSTVGDFTWLKQVGTPWELFEEEDWPKMMRRTHRMLCGHNRAATIGKVTANNAHPFQHEHICGVHNGTLDNVWRLEDGHKHDVDSSAIYANIAKNGIEETLKKIDGAATLVWYDAEEHKVFLVRNEKRPLCMTKSEDGRTYFWASEGWMLQVALGKCNIKHGEIVEVEAGKLISFKVPTGPDVSKLENFLPSVKAVKFYEAPSRSDWDYMNRGSWNDHHARSGGYHYNSAVRSTATNVAPFVRQAIGESTLRGYLHKEVVFSVIGERVINHQNFILCEVEDMTSPDIRIFAQPKTKLGKLLLSSDGFFKGKVKGMTAKTQFGHYLTLDHRSIRECDKEEVSKVVEQRDESVDPEEVVEQKTFPVYAGNLVSIEEWYKRTINGCLWCSDFATPKIANQLEWVNVRDFLCPDCQKLTEVRQYTD